MNLKIGGTFDIRKDMYTRVMSYGYLHPDNVGRLYASVTSISSLSKEMRYLLFKDYYTNVDLVNSYVSILYHFAENNSLSNKSLEKYLINCQKLMEHLHAELKLKNLAEAKKIVLQVINLKYYSGKNTFLKEFFEDICVIRERIYDTFPLEKPLFMKNLNQMEAYQAKSLDEKKITIQSLYCHTRESEILVKLYTFLQLKYEKKPLNWLEKMNMSKIKEVNEGLEFIPFADNAYIKFKDLKMEQYLPKLIDEFNKELPMYINFAIKEIKLDTIHLYEEIFDR